MPKTKNNQTVSKPRSTQGAANALSGSLTPISLFAGQSVNSAGARSSTKPGASNELPHGKVNGYDSYAQGIKFGAPSSSTTTPSSSGSAWSSLIKQTASGGVASALGGNFGLGSIAGLGSLISSVVSLFGGQKKTPAPLADFSLPGSINQTSYVRSSGSTLYQGTSSQPAANNPPAMGIYRSSAAVPQSASTTAHGGQLASASGGGSSTQTQSAQIVQAVKIALLNSSSLNDVIGDI